MIKKLLFTFSLLFLVLLGYSTNISALENNSLLNEIYNLGEVIKFDKNTEVEYLLETPSGDTYRFVAI